jgi:hypothetical protein
MANITQNAKRLHYDNQINKAHNKIKNSWIYYKFRNMEEDKLRGIQSLTIGNKSINNQQSVAEAFNTYFLSVVDNIMNNKNQVYTIDEDNSINNDRSKQSNHRLHN